MPGHALAVDNALVGDFITGESERGYAVADAKDRLVLFDEHPNEILYALVVGDVKDRSRAADDDQCVVTGNDRGCFV